MGEPEQNLLLRWQASELFEKSVWPIARRDALASLLRKYADAGRCVTSDGADRYGRSETIN